jgi:hypothetical protein
MIPAQYVPNQPNTHNNRSSGVSFWAQLLRRRYFGILATVQGALHSTVAIFGVLHGPRDGFRTFGTVYRPTTMPASPNFVVEMGLTNVDGIGSREMVRLLIDFLTESRAGLVSLRSRRKDEGHE